MFVVCRLCGDGHLTGHLCVEYAAEEPGGALTVGHAASLAWCFQWVTPRHPRAQPCPRSRTSASAVTRASPLSASACSSLDGNRATLNSVIHLKTSGCVQILLPRTCTGCFRLNQVLTGPISHLTPPRAGGLALEPHALQHPPCRVVGPVIGLRMSVSLVLPPLGTIFSIFTHLGCKMVPSGCFKEHFLGTGLGDQFSNAHILSLILRNPLGVCGPSLGLRLVACSWQHVAPRGLGLEPPSLPVLTLPSA